MWKTIGGRCIYQSPSGSKVYQNVLYRWLTLDSEAIQTLINRWYPQRYELGYVHHLTLAVREQPADCCLLGLGGAGVAHSLAPYLRNIQLLAVESDADIIGIAKTYFMTARLDHMSVIHQDADVFVRQCNRRYQHVMIDLFDAHSFPTHCNTRDFFAHCYRLLLPGGILALNLANLHEQWPIFNQLRENFQQRTVSMPVKGSANMVILACNSPSIAPLLDLLKKSHHLKKLSWDARWGCIAEI